jgi:DNA invertase Pin-like site-specific DNA recombinase
MSAVKGEHGQRGRSLHSIHGARGGRPRREVDLDRVRELLRAGLSIREAARQLGLGQGTVRRALGLVQVRQGAAGASAPRQKPTGGAL